jgi:hypothetical protein
MIESNKIELYAIIVEISKLSADIDELRKKRDFLLDKFKQIQMKDDKPKSVFKLI